MPASTITNSLPPACGLMSTTRVTSTPAWRDQKPSRLENQIAGRVSRTIGSTRAAYSAAVGTRWPS